MAQSISIDLYRYLEEKVGKEEAQKVAAALEIGLKVVEEKAKEAAVQKKLELKDELTRELVTKAEFLGEMKTVRQEIQTVRQEMQTLKTELEGKIRQLDQKFNFMIILMIIALTLMNPVAAEIIKRFLKL